MPSKKLSPQTTESPDSPGGSIKYANAVWDEQEHRWISEAEIAETPFTAFTSHPKTRQVTCRLVVRRLKRLNPAAAAGQGELFSLWRHHGFITNTTLTAVDADETHRDHAIIGRVIAELKNGPLAHPPDGSRPTPPGSLWPASRSTCCARAGALASVRHATVHLPGRRPGPGRDLRPAARAAPADALALAPARQGFWTTATATAI